MQNKPDNLLHNNMLKYEFDFFLEYLFGLAFLHLHIFNVFEYFLSMHEEYHHLVVLMVLLFLSLGGEVMLQLIIIVQLSKLLLLGR
jgi:hypothetical protein